MVAAFDYCLHGKGGAAPSIDTAMHGLVDAAHVDHLHPDSGIAIATAADGEELTADDLRRQGRLGAVAPSRLPARPRHRRDQGRRTRRRSAASSAATASPPGATPARSPRRTRCGSSTPPRRTSPSTPGRTRSAPASKGTEPLPAAERRAKAAALGADDPRRRLARTGRWSATSPTTEVVLDFLASRRAPAPGRARHVAAPTTSCAPRSSRWCSTCRPTRPLEETVSPRSSELHEAYREDYQAYYDRNATPDSPGDPRRRPADRAGARRRHVLASARTSRPPAWPASSTSTRST